MSAQTIFVATKDKIYLYDLDGMKILAKLPAENHLGRISLSSESEEHPYLVYSTSLDVGELIVYSTKEREEVNKIICHKTIILKLAIGYNGKVVGTCSTSGSLIRVFSLPNGERLYSFNRSIELPSKLLNQYFFTFSANNELLIAF